VSNGEFGCSRRRRFEGEIKTPKPTRNREREQKKTLVCQSTPIGLKNGQTQRDLEEKRG
jgi:hypothetical protein